MKKRGRQPKEAQQSKAAIGDVNDSKEVKQAVEAGNGYRRGGFRGVRRRSSGKFSAEFKSRVMANSHRRYLGTFDSAEEAACAYDSAAVSWLGPKAKTNFPLPLNSSYPQDYYNDPNPNFSSEPCLQDQHQILRPHMPAVVNFSTVESISEHKLQLEQSISLREATPKAQDHTFMAQNSMPDPTTIIPEHQKSLHDEHHKKKKSKQQDSRPDHEVAYQQRLASDEVRPDSGVGASAEGSTEQGRHVPSIWNLGHVNPLETSGANIMHSSDHYCPNWSLKNDRACDALTELIEGSVLPRDKIQALNLPDEILHEQLQAGLANVRCLEMEVLRRFKESNMRLQRISRERDDLALHNNTLVTTNSLLMKHSKEQETKLRRLEAELELCKAELSQSKTELEKKEIDIEIELGAAEHEMEACHQAILNEVETKHKAALSEASEMAVKDFKRSKAFEDDLVVLIAPAYGMGFTEAVDLAKNSGASIDLSQKAFARTYKPGLRDELIQRVALFKEGKDLSEFYQIAGQAEAEAELVVQEHSVPSGDETD